MKIPLSLPLLLCGPHLLDITDCIYCRWDAEESPAGRVQIYYGRISGRIVRGSSEIVILRSDHQKPPWRARHIVEEGEMRYEKMTPLVGREGSRDRKVAATM